MRIDKLIALATRSIRMSAVAWPALGVAIAVFCSSYAGTALLKMGEEKSQSYEFIVSASASVKLDSTAIGQIGQIPGVSAVTATVQLPLSITAGETSADFMALGLQGAFIDRELLAGAVFPDQTAMPYLVLNQAACKRLSGAGNVFDEEQEPSVEDWLNRTLVLQPAGDGQSLSARICAIVRDASEEEPLVWMDLKIAQQLLLSGGQLADSTQGMVRVSKVGDFAAVAEALAARGFSSEAIDDVQAARWDLLGKDALYLFLLAGLSLLFSARLAQVGGGMDAAVLTALRWMGMRERDMRRLHVARLLLIGLYCAGFGLVCLTIPAFIDRQVVADTSFALPVPWWVALGCALTPTLAFFLLGLAGGRIRRGKL